MERLMIGHGEAVSGAGRSAIRAKVRQQLATTGSVKKHEMRSRELAALTRPA
jgi:hypothetical protein